MRYLHIKKLEEYHPGYRDRNLIWCKAHFKMMDADPEFEMMCEIDKWRFMAFVMLELQVKRPIPLDEAYLSRKGFVFKSRSLTLTVEALANSIEIVNDLLQPIEINNVTQLSGECADKPDLAWPRVDKSRVEESRVDTYVAWEVSVLQQWNSFCETHPVLSKVREISDKRRSFLKKRFLNKTFLAFEAILVAVAQQPFLLGNGKQGWKISFDWLIENDTNYLKVLELKYMDTNNQSLEEGVAQWRR